MLIARLLSSEIICTSILLIHAFIRSCIHFYIPFIHPSLLLILDKIIQLVIRSMIHSIDSFVFNPFMFSFPDCTVQRYYPSFFQTLTCTIHESPIELCPINHLAFLVNRSLDKLSQDTTLPT